MGETRATHSCGGPRRASRPSGTALDEESRRACRDTADLFTVPREGLAGRRGQRDQHSRRVGVDYLERRGESSRAAGIT